MYIADCYNHRVRKVTVSTGIITLIAGTGATTYSGDNGDATSAALKYPHTVALDASGMVAITTVCCIICYEILCALCDFFLITFPCSM